MRQAFAEEMLKIISSNTNVFLLTADLGFGLFERIEEKFKKKFINVGVAESNMIGVAAGLSITGKTVVVYSISTFATYRTFEHIRNDVCQQNLHVIIIGTGSGLTYSDAGPSHHGLEDISLLRAIPNINIYTPSDPLETKWALKDAINNKKPAYIRIGKNNPIIFSKRHKFNKVRPNIFEKGKDFLILSHGDISYNSLKSLDILEKKDLKGTLACLSTLKPINEKEILKLLKQYKYIITAEEHTKNGGLCDIIGSIIARNDSIRCKFYTINTPDEFTKIGGTLEFLRDKYGLTPQKIANFVYKNYERD